VAKAKRTAHKVGKAEHRATAAVRRLGDTAPVKALAPLAKLTDEPPLAALAAGTLALGVLLKKPLLVRSGARMLASHLLATGMKTVGKAGVDRVRPAAEGAPHVAKGHGTDDKTRNAFPSGHTAGAVAVGQAVAHEVPGAATPARGLAALAGALQVPRGAHYVSDVLAGAAIGWLAERIAGAALQVAERLAEDRTVAAAEAEVEAHPS
jgi:membrane-associated phospholipid phosphatase